MVTPAVIGGEADVTEFIERERPAAGTIRWIWGLSLGGVFFEAYASTALSAGLGSMISQLRLSPGQVSALAAVSMVVALVCGPVAGWLSDRLGRVPMLIAAKGVALVSAALAAFAPGFGLLLVARAVSGLAWALDFAVVIAYLSEFLPRRTQSKLNRWQGTWYVASTGCLLFTVGVYQLGVGETIWRYSLASAGVLALVLGVLQIFLLSESPRWLASQGRLERAARSLRRVYRVEVRAAERPAAGAPAPRRRTSLADIRELLRPPYRRRTVLATVTFCAQGLEYYAVGWYLPVISLRLFGGDFVPANLGSALFNVFGIVGGFASGALAQRFTIRRTMMVGFGLVTAVLVALGALFAGLPLALTFTLPALFLLFHSAGAAPGGMSLAAAAYPSSLRALGSGVTNMAGNTGGLIGSFVFPLVLAALGPGATILVMAIVPAIGFATSALIRFDPELNSGTDDDAGAVASGTTRRA
jgi:MFS transporter, putative metabolite transport protein